MVDSPRDTQSRWHRARRSYLELVADADPVPAEMRDGIVDLRPGWDQSEFVRLVEHGSFCWAPGPHDLIELRHIVERMTGAATWPRVEFPHDTEVVEIRRSSIELPRPALALGLVMSMSDLIEDRSRAWRTWPTVVESVGKALGTQSRLTLQTCLAVRR